MSIDDRDDDEISGVFEPSIVEAPPVDDHARVIAGRYEIVERIGEGGMGQVLRVRHQRLGKPFALKLMQADFSLQPESRDVFDREARLASALAHPNIVSIVDFGEDPDWGLFIVMELVEGESLAERIEVRGFLPVSVACHVGYQLVSAVRHSHERDVVHGDLKADNVLCVQSEDDERRQWEIKLLDFGMAQVANAGAGRDEVIGGTPEYLAPERITGGPPQPSVDIYALGVLLYEMLAGTVPFRSDDPRETMQRHLSETPEPIGARRGEAVDAALEAIVDRALAKQPSQRYATAAELGEDLLGYMQERGLRNRAVGRRPTTGPGDTRDDAEAAAFAELPIPAAGLLDDGTIVVANRAMARLLNTSSPQLLEGHSLLETALARIHPTIRDDLRLVAMDGKLVRRRVSVPRREGMSTMRIVMTPARGPCGHCILVLHASAAHSKSA